jgi:hypothetical protein
MAVILHLLVYHVIQYNLVHIFLHELIILLSCYLLIIFTK